MKVYAVISTVGGFAHEDPDVATLHGVFTEYDPARITALIRSAKVIPIELNNVFPGYRRMAEELGLKYPEPAIRIEGQTLTLNELSMIVDGLIAQGHGNDRVVTVAHQMSDVIGIRPVTYEGKSVIVVEDAWKD